MPLANMQHLVNQMDQLLTKNIDLRGRRVINADDARSEGEYVTLRQHRSLIAKIVAPILDSISNIYKFRDSGGKSYSNIIVGNLVNRPTPGIEGRIFIPIDTAAPPDFWYDDSITWVRFSNWRPY